MKKKTSKVLLQVQKTSRTQNRTFCLSNFTITLGIGKLVEAEVSLRKVFPKQCEFFGVDPSVVYNKALVESYNGTFFEAAIGDKSEIKDALIRTGEFPKQ
ncbi:unnamed protein product [Enterobius vermicularis]|uniref:Transposase n=1 Tax=Enterobius vermicularis TaxID=51028 RepID=A0A0N4VQE9_ENTVE|nr:unnamed protein product [Enterobius vermicularis]